MRLEVAFQRHPWSRGPRGHWPPRLSQGPANMLTMFVVFTSCSLGSITHSETAELEKLETAHVASVGLLREKEPYPGLGPPLGSLGRSIQNNNLPFTPSPSLQSQGPAWTGRFATSEQTCREAQPSARHSDLRGPLRAQPKGTDQWARTPSSDCRPAYWTHPPIAG